MQENSKLDVSNEIEQIKKAFKSSCRVISDVGDFQFVVALVLNSYTKVKLQIDSKIIFF